MQDQSVSRVVGRNADRDLIPNDDTNFKSLHFAAEFCGNRRPVFELYDILATTSRIGDRPIKFQKIFF